MGGDDLAVALTFRDVACYQQSKHWFIDERCFRDKIKTALEEIDLGLFDPESSFLFLPPIFFKLNKKNRGRHNIIGTQIRCSSVAAGRSVFLPNYGNARYMYRGLSVIAGTTVSIYRSVLESEYESFCVLEFHDRMYGISNFFSMFQWMSSRRGNRNS